MPSELKYLNFGSAIKSAEGLGRGLLFVSDEELRQGQNEGVDAIVRCDGRKRMERVERMERMERVKWMERMERVEGVKRIEMGGPWNGSEGRNG